MKTITIRLDDETARWARIEAAKEGKSLSRYLGQLLADRRGSGVDEKALEEFLRGPGWPDIAADLPRREGLYD